jgi:hypothetical protein
MPWFNVDDAIPDMPEVMRIPRRYRLAAMGLWSLAGGWVSRHLTGGFVPDEVIQQLGGTPTLKAQLIACGLWDEAPGGVAYTARGCRVPRPEDVQKQRADTADRVRKHRAKQRKPPNQRKQEDVTALQGEPVTACHGIHTSPFQANSVGLESTQGYASNAPARTDDATFELATSERGLSPPVNVGASRLVAIVFPNGAISDADRTILRLKASEAIHDGRSEDDVAECLRIWKTKNDLGPNALLCCLTEVDKRKLNGQPKSTSDQRFMAAQALKKKPTRRELTQ